MPHRLTDKIRKISKSLFAKFQNQDILRKWYRKGEEVIEKWNMVLAKIESRVSVLRCHNPIIKRMLPTPRPNRRLSILINMESFRLYDKSGSIPCPSWTKDVVKRTEKGTSPFAYIMTNIRCGPDSGMIPRMAPIINTHTMCWWMKTSKFQNFRPKCTISKAPKLHKNTRNRCFLIICSQMWSWR